MKILDDGSWNIAKIMNVNSYHNEKDRRDQLIPGDALYDKMKSVDDQEMMGMVAAAVSKDPKFVGRLGLSRPYQVDALIGQLNTIIDEADEGTSLKARWRTLVSYVDARRSALLPEVGEGS